MPKSTLKGIEAPEKWYTACMGYLSDLKVEKLVKFMVELLGILKWFWQRALYEQFSEMTISDIYCHAHVHVVEDPEVLKMY